MSLLVLHLSLAGCVAPEDAPKGGAASDVDSGPGAPTDADGDGVTDVDEATVGTDPASADTDGDGLADGDELTRGSDPLTVDTDGDGYTDYDEVQTGHDPTSKKDAIYTGGWPYNPDKDAIEDPGWAGNAAQGATLPHYVSYDQFGDEFDFYDFGGQDKPVIIDVSAGWCYYCQEMAKLVAGQRSYFDDYASSYPGIAQIKDLVDSGDVLWIEVLDQQDDYSKIDEDFLALWDEAFPNKNVAVVADERQKFAQWLPISGYPTVFAMNSNLVIKSFDTQDYISPLNWAVNHVE